MKGLDLFDKIGKIDDKFIIESESYKKKSVIKSFPFIAAASFIIAISAVIFMMPKSESDLPLIVVPNEFQSSMGFEGFKAYDISEIPMLNPIADGNGIDELFVYTNKFPKSNFYLVPNPDYQAMQALLFKTAQSLGVNTDNIIIQNNAYTEEEISEALDKLAFIPEEESYDIPDNMEITELSDGRIHIGPVGEFNLTEYYIESDGMKISVDTTLETTVEFDNSIVATPTSNENPNELYKSAEDIIANFSDFIDMVNPQIAVRGGGYNIYGEQSFDIYIYEGDESEFDIATNYKFDYIWFMVSEDGSITKAVKYTTDILEPIASYPIITLDEAETLLLQGNFISTVPNIAPDGNLVCRVELVYRNDSELLVFIPYYLFYIELPSYKDIELNLSSYGTYYVPAIDGAYIENMPVWDGSFN